MSERKLGSSNLSVSAIGLGCWQFSGGSGLGGNFWRTIPGDLVRAIVKESLRGGVTWFDTAEAYGWGESERALAASLTSLGVQSRDVVVATKWWPVLRPAAKMVSGIEERLRVLRPYPIDLYQVHQPFGRSSVEREMDAMARLVDAGKIRFVGVSNFSARQMRRADAELRRHGLRLISNQVRFSLLHRAIETNGILDTAKELGVTIIGYSPLAQGVLTGTYHDHVKRARPTGYRRYLPDFSRRVLERTAPLVAALREIAASHGATPSQVALQWVVSFHGDLVVAIPGASSPSQAADDAAAQALRLSQEELHRLNEVSLQCINR